PGFVVLGGAANGIVLVTPASMPNTNIKTTLPTTAPATPVTGDVYFNTTTGLIVVYTSPTTSVSVPVQLVVGAFPQRLKYAVSIVAGPKFHIVNPDGTSPADVSCAAATTQTITLTSPAAGVVLESLKFICLTAFSGTGLATFAATMGYSGGDTSGGGAASN